MSGGYRNKRSMRRFYDFLSRFYGLVGLFDNCYKRMAVDGIVLRDRMKVLDAGCGDGYILRYAGRSNPGCAFFGADSSSGMVRRARYGGSGRVFLGDCFSLPFKDGAFDVLFSSFVFDIFSVDEQAGAMSEFLRVVGDGGRIVLVNNVRGHGVFYLLSGFYMILMKMFPFVLFNRPVDAWPVALDAGGLRLRMRRVTGFTEILVFEKVS